MRNWFVIVVVFVITGCQLGRDANNEAQPGDLSKQYKLELNPAAGSSYLFQISTENNSELEIDGKTVNNKSETGADIQYVINKDSLGNYLFGISYNSIKLYTKNGDKETEAIASEGTIPVSSLDRMLGILRESAITATVTKTGQVVSMKGYDEMGEKILASFSPNDINGKAIAQQQWEQLIGKGLVKKNLDQLFKIFPDSAVHLGDKWKLMSKEAGEFDLTITSYNTLKAINDNVALISSEGKIKSDKSVSSQVGHTAVSADLTGTQEAEFQMERQTGMLIGCTIRATIEGTVQLMGLEVPVKIKSLVKVKGKKLEGSEK